jgi:Flp pilus assembly protein TadG
MSANINPSRSNAAHSNATYSTATRRSATRTGAFTVEFAICCGLFFTILMASIEFTRFMYARHSVDQAAYESARVGIVPGRTPADVIARANQILNATGVRNATVTVTPTVFNSSTASVTVNIRCAYADSSWLRPVFLLNSDLLSEITIDHENQAYLVSATGNVGNNNNAPIDH